LQLDSNAIPVPDVHGQRLFEHGQQLARLRRIVAMLLEFREQLTLFSNVVLALQDVPVGGFQVLQQHLSVHQPQNAGMRGLFPVA
jgi:hypothetical protein